MKYPNFDEKIWYQEFECPLCGYKSIVTNVCRSCPMTPADEPSRCPYYCDYHKTIHWKDRKPMMHRGVNMKPTEWAKRFNPNIERTEKKKVKNLPKDAILK